MLYTNRYKNFISENKMFLLPNITIPESSTDKIVVYKKGITRMDKLSQTYYGSPFFGPFILMANPKYEGMEFDIPSDALIRIPYPLNRAVELYNEEVNKHINLEGL